MSNQSKQFFKTYITSTPTLQNEYFICFENGKDVLVNVRSDDYDTVQLKLGIVEPKTWIEPEEADGVKPTDRSEAKAAAKDTCVNFLIAACENNDAKYWFHDKQMFIKAFLKTELNVVLRIGFTCPKNIVSVEDAGTPEQKHDRFVERVNKIEDEGITEDEYADVRRFLESVGL